MDPESSSFYLKRIQILSLKSNLEVVKMKFNKTKKKRYQMLVEENELRLCSLIQTLGMPAGDHNDEHLFSH